MKQDKLTKKQKEQLENEIRCERAAFVGSIKDYWKDCEAAERYLKTKGEYLTEDERERLLSKYNNLKQYKASYDKDSNESGMWTAIRIIVSSYKTARNEPDRDLSESLSKDDLLIDDTLWGIDDIRLVIKLGLRYGYRRAFITDNSTMAMSEISKFIELGGKVEKTFYNSSSDRYGLIINIENCKYEQELIQDECIIEKIRHDLVYLGENIKCNFCTDTLKRNIMREYSPTYGVLKTIETFYTILQQVTDERIDE